MRYLGEGLVACPYCEGYGVDLNDPEAVDCGRCDGTGAVLVENYVPITEPRPYVRKYTIWSTLLCDPDTIERMSA